MTVRAREVLCNKFPAGRVGRDHTHLLRGVCSREWGRRDMDF